MAKNTKWMDHVMKIKKENPKLALSAILKKASKSYKK